MGLELKHLAPYLPYKLQMRFEGKGGRIITLETLGTSFLGDTISGGNGGMWLKSCGFKPILRSLSDLTKEIEVNGEKFVPMKKILDQKTLDSYKLKKMYRFGEFDKIKKLPYDLFQKLLEWKFDVFGLIEKGLAIDINTL